LTLQISHCRYAIECAPKNSCGKELRNTLGKQNAPFGEGISNEMRIFGKPVFNVE
jgi:hypothetical protein